jgi:hypothetical protein
MVVSVGSSSTIARRVGGVFAALVCMVALSAGSASAAPKPLPRPVPVAEDALARALAAGRLSPAKYTLERARSLFRLGAVRREFGDVARPDPHAATFILRDLALRLGELPAAERREAARLLARPSDQGADPFGHGWNANESQDSPVCDAHICIHWVDLADDPANGPSSADTDGDGVPNWVESVVQPTFATVWTEEIEAPPVGLGNPAPLSDDTSPNDGGRNPSDPDRTKLDVYLADVGAAGFFGYCTTDDPREYPDYLYWDRSAYCVVDNDFADFGPPWTPTQYLQVTAAHEFRHASQFAEDAFEDLWFMEGEAMWIEGEVFPEVTDRWDYLSMSPLGNPSRALDHGANSFEYGAWVFFRFLSEHYGDPAVIREAWNRADGSGDSDGIGPDGVGPDEYSMEAVGTATLGRGESLASAFTLFTRWNRSPALAGFYEEGADYPTPGAVATYALKPTAPTTGWKTAKLRHLASAHYSLRPGRGTRSTTSVKVTVDLPDLGTKPAVTLLLFYKSGAYAAKPISLDSSGNGAKTVAFGKGVVSRVDVLLTNASARYTCWQYVTTYSCGGGIPRDDNRAYSFKAKLR